MHPHGLEKYLVHNRHQIQNVVILDILAIAFVQNTKYKIKQNCLCVACPQ